MKIEIKSLKTVEQGGIAAIERSTGRKLRRRGPGRRDDRRKDTAVWRLTVLAIRPGRGGVMNDPDRSIEIEKDGGIALTELPFVARVPAVVCGAMIGPKIPPFLGN